MSDSEHLEGTFLDEEVTIALSKLGGDKAPKPNWFSKAFWKSCWPIVGREVMQLFEEFQFKDSLVLWFLFPRKEWWVT